MAMNASHNALKELLTLYASVSLLKYLKVNETSKKLDVKTIHSSSVAIRANYQIMLKLRTHLNLWFIYVKVD